MAATGDLRRMLDERGVEWEEEGPNKTRWSHDGIEYVACNAWPRNGGATRLILHANLTPEQAVAATVRRGTCHATPNPPVPKHWTGCSNCGSVWDFFYNICGYMGPPNFCPNCGRKVVDG